MRRPGSRGSQRFWHPTRRPSKRPPLPASYFAPLWEETSSEIFAQLIEEIFVREKLTLSERQYYYCKLLRPVNGGRPSLGALVSTWDTLLSGALTDRCVWPVWVERPVDGGEPYLLVENGTRATKKGVARRLAKAGVPDALRRAYWYGAINPVWDKRPRRRLIRAWIRSTRLPLPPGLGRIGVTRPWAHMRLGGRELFRLLEDQVLRYHSLGPSQVTAEDVARWLSSTDVSVREFAFEALGRWNTTCDDAPHAPRTSGAE